MPHNMMHWNSLSACWHSMERSAAVLMMDCMCWQGSNLLDGANFRSSNTRIQDDHPRAGHLAPYKNKATTSYRAAHLRSSCASGEKSRSTLPSCGCSYSKEMAVTAQVAQSPRSAANAVMLTSYKPEGDYKPLI
ncbi:hypothetical protein ABBQ38_012029 [Trebouxia sp. C0009 RCD-2024]